MEHDGMQESLPSHSLFVRHVEDEDLSSPPPPPPPPLPVKQSMVFQSMAKTAPSTPQVAASTRSAGRGSGTPSSSERKPFLRKGSRVEPSAMNRKTSPSPVTVSKPVDEAVFTFAQLQQSNGSVSSKNPNTSSYVPTYAMDYDDSREEDTGSSPDKSLSFTDGSGREIGSGWKAKKDNAKKELDEFMLLEQEVEGMDLDPFSASRTLRFSTEKTAFSAVRNSREGLSAPTFGFPSGPTSGSSASSAFGAVAHSSNLPSPGLAETNEIKALRPVASAAASLSNGASYGLLSSSGISSSHTASDFGIYDFDEQPSSGPAQTEQSINVEDGSYELVNSSSSSRSRGQPSRPSVSAIDDSQSWGATTRPNLLDSRAEDQTDYYASSASWSSPQHFRRAASPAQAQSQSQASQAQRLSLSSSGPVIRPKVTPVGGPSPSSSRGGRGSGARTNNGHRTSPSPGLGNRGHGGHELDADEAEAEAAALKAQLHVKAKELEQELNTYRQENSQLKQLRKQQEQALQEVAAQRAELLRYVSEEKAKTEGWCEEQRAAAARDRRAAAKIARDAREGRASGGGTGSSGGAGVLGVSARRDRAEVEALQATIEKLKLDAAETRKRSKANELRLNQLSKDQATALEETQQELVAFENEAVMLLKYLDQAAIRVPASVVGKRMAKIKKSEAARPHQGYRSSYVEEVPVEDLMVGHAKVLASSAGAGAGAGAHGGSAAQDSCGSSLAGSMDSATPSGSGGLAAAIFRTGGASGFSGTGTQESQSRTQTQVQIQAQAQAQNVYDPSRYAAPSSSSSSSAGAAAAGKSVVRELIQANLASSPTRLGRQRGASETSSGLGSGILRSQGQTVVSSWGQSSRSSRETRSSRYSSGEAEDDENDALDDDDEEDVFGVNVEQSAAESGFGAASTSFRLPASTGGQAPISPSKSIVINTAAPAHSSFSVSDAPLPEDANSGNGGSTRTEEVLADGRRVIRYRNGTIKEVLTDGRSIVKFVNGDTKHISSDGGTVVYFYAQASTTHTTYRGGLEVYEFPNGQVEKNYPGGKKEIIFPDSTRKVIEPDGVTHSYFPDGVQVTEHPDGQKLIKSSASY